MELWFDYFVSNAVAASMLAVVVAVVTRLWRSGQLAHALWLVVLVKLVSPPLVPVVLDTPFASVWHRSPARTLNVSEPKTPSARDDALRAFDNSAPYEVDEAATDDARRTAAIRTPRDVAAGTTVASTQAGDRPISRTHPWLPFVFAIWLTGSLLRLTLVSNRVARFHRIARRVAPADAAIRRRAASLAKQLNLRRCPEIRVVEGRLPPMVWSASWRPVVLLPVDLLSRLDGDQQASLIMHELAHIRRRDHWIRWLEMAVLTVCWWNPVAWWARSRIQAAEEECCDGWVVATLPHCSRQYGRALLETVEFLNERSRPLPVLASGFGQGPLLKRRIYMIVRQRVSHRLAWPGVLLALLVALVVLPTVAQDPRVDPELGVQPIVSDDGLILRFGPDVGGQPSDRTLPEAPSRRFRPLGSGTWMAKWDHDLDGEVVTHSFWELQLDFRNDNVTGNVLSVSDGSSNDSIFSGQFNGARSNRSGETYGRFVSVLVLRQDTSDNGYFVVNTAHRVSPTRFKGTWVDSIGQHGDFEMTLVEENSP